MSFDAGAPRSGSASAVADTSTHGAPDSDALAACVDVTVRYGTGESEITALDHVSLSLLHNETVALWGPSGSGKTTLLHVLGGLVESTEGAVTWNGVPLETLDVSARARVRARGIAYVFQGANLLPAFTAYENVAFAAYVSGASDDIEPRALELLTLVGLADKADHLPSELSGGESQRAAIARGLAQRPDLLLCDEPTGHLDMDTGARVLDLIRALRARVGFTLVVATHDADLAAGLGRLVELRDGRLVADTG